ncbi:MAG: fibronectin type III domain-containing protein [Kineosporiaceae bacterium]|nr:fibronectin type III domain-containing protein [Kineosporiaceae bacterium]MBK7625488.1 fibronectin type III domain-containing protein [Kineosporiaceae bacterium]MBK8076149.1 fibronectin type III domain-containing protein [Kineosporiaceae bacterium]
MMVRRSSSASAGRRFLVTAGAVVATAVAIALPAQTASAAVPLAIEAGPDTTISEGSAFTRTIAITDEVDDLSPGWTYSVDYGDGTLGGEQTTTVPSITLSHVYTNGTAQRTVSVVVMDGSESAMDTVVVTVANVPPTASLTGPAAVNEMTPYVGQVTATDPGTDPLTYFLHWNDGLQVQWFIPIGTGLVQHYYLDDADGPVNSTPHTLTLSVSDGEAITVVTNSVAVNNVAPVMPITGAATTTVGTTYSVTLGSAVDPGPDTRTGGVLRWGDGSTQAAAVGTFTHTYTSAGAKTVSVDVTDEDGTFTAGSLTVNVASAAPSAPSNLTATATSRSAIRLNWTNTTTNQTSVQIERCKGVGCTSFTRVATVSGTAVSYSNTGLSGKTTYTYRIRSVNAAGTSPYSTVVAARTL